MDSRVWSDSNYLSMNLFLWFRDDWFYLQFVMVAIIVFGKEFLRWKRDGHVTHIFNPSAFALFDVYCLDRDPFYVDHMGQ